MKMTTQEKPAILLSTSRAISTKSVFHLMCDILNEIYDSYSDTHTIYFISNYSDKNRVLKLFTKHNRDVFFDEILLQNDYFTSTDFDTAKDWQEIYDTLDISSLPKFDKIIDFGTPLSVSFKNINYDKLYKSKNCFTFVSIKKLYKYIVITSKIALTQNIEIEHHIMDPQELNYLDLYSNIENFKYKRVFPYTSSLKNFTRDDTYLNYYKKNFIKNDYTESDYKYDFTFGFTIVTKDRKTNLYDELNRVLKDNDLLDTSNLYVLDKYNKIDTTINRDLYLNKISQSKFTLIMPAYDIETFSIFRYIESIYNGCVPLILDTNYLDEVKKDFYVPDDIIVSVDNIGHKILTLDHKKILSELKESFKGNLREN